MFNKNTKNSSVHMAQPIYPRKIQRILDKPKNCSAIGKMERLCGCRKRDAHWSLSLCWSDLVCLISPMQSLPFCLQFTTFSLQSAFICTVYETIWFENYYYYYYLMSCFVRVAPVMIHGLNVKKHKCGFGSEKRCLLWDAEHGSPST